jgi:hypothetical protein
MATNLTQRDRAQITNRVKQLVGEIEGCARTARTIDPSEPFSYPAMYGGMQSVLTGLVRDLAGLEAEQLIRQAFERADAGEQEGGAA